jgi:hypothetical protein
MKYVKMLGLAAVAAMALMAFIGASSASATVLCKTNLSSGCAAAGWDYSGPLESSLAPGTSAFLENTSGTIEDTCTGSTVKGEANTPAGATGTVTGAVTTANLGWSGCSQTTATVHGGTLEVHNIAGTSNGTLTAKEFEVTIVLFGVTCTYGAGAGIDLGTVTEGNPATIDINTVVNKTAGNFLCPSTSTWKGTYQITAPTGTLGVSAS